MMNKNQGALIVFLKKTAIASGIRDRFPGLNLIIPGFRIKIGS
jgi:hypothetical protein